MGTATLYIAFCAERIEPSFVFLTSGHSDAQLWAPECPDVKNYKWRLNQVWHRMLFIAMPIWQQWASRGFWSCWDLIVDTGWTLLRHDGISGCRTETFCRTSPSWRCAWWLQCVRRSRETTCGRVDTCGRWRFMTAPGSGKSTPADVVTTSVPYTTQL